MAVRGSKPVGRGWEPAGMGSETAGRDLPSSSYVYPHLCSFTYFHTYITFKQIELQPLEFSLKPHQQVNEQKTAQGQ